MAKLKVVARVTRRAKEPWRARTYCECGQEQRVMPADFEEEVEGNYALLQSAQHAHAPVRRSIELVPYIDLQQMDINYGNLAESTNRPD